jgi:hypothetical protein
MRFREHIRRGHHGRGTKAHPGPAKPDSVCYRRIIENPLLLTLLGEQRTAASTTWWMLLGQFRKALEKQCSHVELLFEPC